MRIAFKEWEIVVAALGTGRQILIFRKGGIAEGPGGFKPTHDSFLLFPTQFHQQRDGVIAEAQTRFDVLTKDAALSEEVRLEFWAQVSAWRQIESLTQIEALRGQHIWKDEVLADRLDWGREKFLYVMAVRVFRLRTALELPLVPEYGGCKSWLELTSDVDLAESQPVLSDDAFAKKLERFNITLEPVPVAP